MPIIQTPPLSLVLCNANSPDPTSITCFMQCQWTRAYLYHLLYEIPFNGPDPTSSLYHLLYEMPMVLTLPLPLQDTCFMKCQWSTSTLTSCFGLITDLAVVDSALVDAALRKYGLIIYLCGLRQIHCICTFWWWSYYFQNYQLCRFLVLCVSRTSVQSSML